MLQHYNISPTPPIKVKCFLTGHKHSCPSAPLDQEKRKSNQINLERSNVMGFYNNHSIPLLLPQQYLSSEVVVESESVFCVQ